MSIGSNTEILIKRSLSTGVPGSLQQGELAYSYASNTIFIGTPDGLGTVNVGGQYYTAQVDAATDSATGGTLVKRDSSGNATFSTIFTALGTDSGVDAGSYGDQTHIPVITVAANGLVTNVTTSEISTTLNIAGDSGSNVLSLITDTLTITGGEGITSSVSGNDITLDVDETVVRSNTESVGTQHISTDVQISGNLTVQGTTTYVQTAINQTDDSMIELAANNTVGDVLDIGFYGKHEGTDGTVVTGLVRNAGTSDFYLFDNISIGDQANLTSNLITQSSLSANGASLYASQFLASEGTGATGGFSFNGDGGLDTGMFSPTDGELHFYSNDQQIISANTDVVSFGRDLKLQSSGAINNPAESSGDGGAYATLELRPDTTLGTDQYIVIDPTVPNHIHLRAGGTIDSSSADLFLGAENNHVQVSDSGNFVSIKTDSSNTWTFGSNGILELPNGTTISDAGGSGLFVDSLNAAETSNIVFYNTDTKELTYGSMADLRPDRIQSGSYYWEVDASTGALFSDAGTYIGDSGNSVIIGQSVDLTNTNTNRVAIGNGAGQSSQGYGSTAIGDGAGNSNQSQWAVALGLNAGNSSQGNSTVAVGHSAGRTNQGSDSVAIGVSAGQTSQGQFAVAIGERAGYGNSSGQGDYSVMIGSRAGYSSAAVNSIVLNASGSELNSSESGLYINPIRYTETQDSTYDGLMFYNANTKEVRYSYTLDGGSF